eukprot:3047926-Rhodomonas_salina.1
MAHARSSVRRSGAERSGRHVSGRVAADAGRLRPLVGRGRREEFAVRHGHVAEFGGYGGYVWRLHRCASRSEEGYARCALGEERVGAEYGRAGDDEIERRESERERERERERGERERERERKPNDKKTARARERVEGRKTDQNGVK